MSQGDHQSQPAFRRIVDQRVRNNVMDELDRLAQGDRAVTTSGYSEYFEALFDDAPYEGALPNCAMTEEEVGALEAFCTEFRRACDETPSEMSEEAFIATGWPARLAPLARKTLDAFMKRGYLSTEEVQDR